MRGALEMAQKSGATSTAYIKTVDLTETVTSQSLKGIYPSVTNAVLVDALEAIGTLQTQTVTTYSRQDKYKLVED